MDEEQTKNENPEQDKRESGVLHQQEQEKQAPPKKRTLSRRQFLIISAIAGGAVGTGLLIEFTVLRKPGNTVKQPAASFSPNIWVRINADNTITIHVARSEMGQGVMTALPMLVAEELDANWANVRVEQALADEQYGDQKTDGSSSVPDSFSALRSAGALARALLVTAAAQTWGVHYSTCRTENGEVIHLPSGRRLPYSDLIGVASTLKPNPTTLAPMKLKQPDQFTLIGTRVPRVDTPHKIDGSAIFGLDVRLPGMRYATIARCPFLGGALGSFDDTKARAVPGVVQVVQIKSGIAVVAQNTWAAIQGRQALEVKWQPGPNALLDSAGLRAQLAAEAHKLADERIIPLVNTAQTIEAVYETPFLAHATMEPMNCTAWVQPNRCEVWAPTQDPQGAKLAASLESGLPLQAITLHVTLAGGGFGRRVQTDFIVEAVQVSKAIHAPVQVVWTREDDFQHDFYRPASTQHLSASLTPEGLPATWTHIVTIPSFPGLTPYEGAQVPYAIASTNITGSQVPSAVPSGIWRGTSYSNTIFAMEGFLDEVAAAGGLDPYQLRLQLLSNNARLQAVLQLAASKAGWGSPLPAGTGRGMALCVYGNAAVAEVAEVSIASDYSVQVQRVVCAVDCGLVINPSIAEGQVEGAVVDGLTAMLKGEITVANGQIQQQSFRDYPLLRMNEMPATEVYFISSTDGPYGLGELGLPPIAPAVTNAIFAATGRRIRRLPIQADDLR